MSLMSGLRKALRMISSRLPHVLKSAMSRQRPTLGAGAYVDVSVHIIGARAVRIGRNSIVSEGTWLNVNDLVPNRFSIDIHDNCFIGKRNFFSSGSQIELLPYTLTAIDCKFIGSSHVVDDPYVPVLTSGTTSDWRIRIGANCFLGAGAAVVGNVSIGHGCVIGSLSLVTADIPPFSMVVGSPARVIRRFSHSAGEWVSAESFTDIDDRSLPDEASYLKLLTGKFGDIGMPLPAAGRNMGNI